MHAQTNQHPIRAALRSAVRHHGMGMFGAALAILITYVMLANASNAFITNSAVGLLLILGVVAIVRKVTRVKSTARHAAKVSRKISLPGLLIK
jgi:hypothetical protein